MSVTFPVELGHVMLFRRAIGDSDSTFLANARDGHGDQSAPLFAPPTFTQVAAQWDPDYWLRPRPGHPWHGSGQGSGTLPDGGGVLHAEQHFTYHRPVRVGDVLTRTDREGRRWEKTGRSGALSFSELISEFRSETDELVVTVRAVRVARTEVDA